MEFTAVSSITTHHQLGPDQLVRAALHVRVAAGRVMYLKPVGAVLAPGQYWRQHKRRQYRAVWIDGKLITDEGVLISG